MERRRSLLINAKKKSMNLLPPFTETSCWRRAFIKSDGSYVGRGAGYYALIPMIPIIGGEYYTLSCGNDAKWKGICYYDANEQAVGFGELQNPRYITLQAPSNAVGVKVYFNDTAINIMLKRGDTPGEYEPYEP